MLRDFVAAGLAFVAVFIFIIAWPDQVMLGLIAAVFAISAVVVIITAPPVSNSLPPH